MARRRRATQSIVVASGIIGLVVAVMLYVRVPHVPSIGSIWQDDLMTSLVTLPVAADAPGAPLLVPTESGDLLTVDWQRHEVRRGFTAEFPLRAQPLVTGGTAYVPCQDGTLYAVEWSSGNVLWSRATGVAMTTRPASANVLMPERPRPAPVATPVPEGTPLADAALPSAAPAVPAPTPIPSPRPVVFAANDEGTVLALEASSGKLLWKRNATGPAGDALTVAQDDRGQCRVLVPLLGGVASRGGLWCLDGASGKVLWKFPSDTKTFAAQYAAPVVDATPNDASTGRVFCVDDSGAVMCLDLKSGKKIWKTFAQPLATAAPNSLVLMRGEPLLTRGSDGDRLYAGGSDCGLRCFDAATGRLQWVFDTGAPVRCRARAVRADTAEGPRDIIITGCDGPGLYALDAARGTLLWRYKTRGAAYAGPVVADKSVVTLTSDGTVQQFPTVR